MFCRGQEIIAKEKLLILITRFPIFSFLRKSQQHTRGCLFFFLFVCVPIVSPVTRSTGQFPSTTLLRCVYSLVHPLGGQPGGGETDGGSDDTVIRHLNTDGPRCVSTQSQCCVHVFVCVKGRGISHPGGPRCGAENHCCSLGSRRHSRGTSLHASPSLLCPA